MMDRQDGSSRCHIRADRANALRESANEAWIYGVPETRKAELSRVLPTEAREGNFTCYKADPQRERRSSVGDTRVVAN